MFLTESFMTYRRTRLVRLSRELMRAVHKTKFMLGMRFAAIAQSIQMVHATPLALENRYLSAIADV